MFINEDGDRHIVPSSDRFSKKKGSIQSVRFFLYWGACCGLSPGDGRVDFAVVGICWYAGLSLAGPGAADEEELERPGALVGATFGGGGGLGA